MKNSAPNSHAGTVEFQVFEHEQFGKVNTMYYDGELWLIGKEITSILGYSNSRKALIDHVDAEDKNTVTIRDGIAGNPNKTIINESGLYSLILSSKLPQAKDFRRWITSVVLPSIGRHGAYITGATLHRMSGNPEFTESLLDTLMIEYGKNATLQEDKEVLAHKNKSLTAKNKTLSQQNKSLSCKVGSLEGELDSLAPDAYYCAHVLRCGDAIQPSIIAKDYGLSTVTFNRLLNSLGIQYRMGGKGTWLLYQKYADMGYTKSRTFYTPTGYCAVHTYWTQRGRQFLYERLADAGIYPIYAVE
jgi:prophage antirepressor-like protein